VCVCVLPKQNDKQQPGERKWHGCFLLAPGQYDINHMHPSDPVYYVRTTRGVAEELINMVIWTGEIFYLRRIDQQIYDALLIFLIENLLQKPAHKRVFFITLTIFLYFYYSVLVKIQINYLTIFGLVLAAQKQSKFNFRRVSCDINISLSKIFLKHNLIVTLKSHLITKNRSRF
jgi:hypothetical protein